MGGAGRRKGVHGVSSDAGKRRLVRAPSWMARTLAREGVCKCAEGPRPASLRARSYRARMALPQTRSVSCGIGARRSGDRGDGAERDQVTTIRIRGMERTPGLPMQRAATGKAPAIPRIFGQSS